MPSWFWIAVAIFAGFTAVANYETGFADGQADCYSCGWLGRNGHWNPPALWDPWYVEDWDGDGS